MFALDMISKYQVHEWGGNSRLREQDTQKTCLFTLKKKKNILSLAPSIILSTLLVLINQYLTKMNKI